MNIFLVPYTWYRHFIMGFFCAGAGLLAWWVVLVWMVALGPTWSPSWDGAFYLGALSLSIAGSSVLGEGLLRRRRPHWLILTTLLAAGISAGLSYLLYWFYLGVLAPGILSPLLQVAIEKLGWFTTHLGASEVGGVDIKLLLETVPDDVKDPNLVSLRYRLGAFVMVGIATTFGPAVVRKFRGFLAHLESGFLCGLAAAGVWHLFNYVIETDLYHAAAAAAATWGFCFGVFAWGIPDELYAGWVRVLSWRRFGRRIPVDAPDGSAKERFVGHFPRGLDLFLPVEDRVQELHLSVAVDEDQNYNARGLTLAPTTVKRFLERVDLRYDPRRPAPLETRITSGDRIRLGEGPSAAELEFLMLPREER